MLPRDGGLDFRVDDAPERTLLRPRRVLCVQETQEKDHFCVIPGPIMNFRVTAEIALLDTICISFNPGLKLY